VLHELGIDIKWEGPRPDKPFARSGQVYVRKEQPAQGVARTAAEEPGSALAGSQTVVRSEPDRIQVVQIVRMRICLQLSRNRRVWRRFGPSLKLRAILPGALTKQRRTSQKQAVDGGG
jgi:hypothetical protein